MSCTLLTSLEIKLSLQICLHEQNLLSDFIRLVVYCALCHKDDHITLGLLYVGRSVDTFILYSHTSMLQETTAVNGFGDLGSVPSMGTAATKCPKRNNGLPCLL